MRGLLIDPLSINFGIVGITIVVGWLILHGLIWIESVTWGATGFEVMTYVPLFPMALVGGILVQLTFERLGWEPLVIQPLMQNIAGLALDVVVVTALASISLQVIGSDLGVFLILSVVGIAWNLLFFLYYAPRIFPDHWFEKGIGDLGQSMGVTATGILLLRMVDPHNDSGAFERFAYKQLFFEPIVGGGLFAAAAPALIARFGLGRYVVDYRQLTCILAGDGGDSHQAKQTKTAIAAASKSAALANFSASLYISRRYQMSKLLATFRQALLKL